MTISTSAQLMRRRSGFSLVEVMITVTLLAMVLASLIGTFSFFSKSAVSLGQYVNMSSSSRYGLELIARDLHGAVDVTLAEKQQLTLVMPADAGSATINYAYDSNLDQLTRSVTDTSGATTSQILFHKLTEFDFYYYDRLDNQIDRNSDLQANVIAQGKSILVEAKLVETAITKKNTDYIISARFMMRNYNGT